MLPPPDRCTPPADEETLTAAWLTTPLGPMLALARNEGVSLLEFVDWRPLDTQIAAVRERTRCMVVPGKHPHLDTLGSQLNVYFEDPTAGFTVPLAPHGTAFERSVWDELLKIPRGETRSYAQIAQRLGKPDASRAIGRANGANPIGILIPCHRVIASDGTLHGYAGGLKRKRRLLEHEGALAPLFGAER